MVGSRALLVLGIFATSLIWTANFARPDGRTHLLVLGDKTSLSLILTLPDGKVALVNPTDSASFLEELGRVLPFYKRDLDLVVETKPFNSAGEALAKRYQVREVWLPETEQNISKDIKYRQVLGSWASDWGGLTWRLFYLPNQEMAVYFTRGKGSVLFTPHGKESYWDALPNFGPVHYLVGPTASSDWTGKRLVDRFNPKVVFTNKAVGTISQERVVVTEEIVW